MDWYNKCPDIKNYLYGKKPRRHWKAVDGAHRSSHEVTAPRKHDFLWTKNTK